MEQEQINIIKEVVYYYAGSSGLATQMKKLKINYTKVYRGFKTIYVLRRNDFGRIEVVL